MSFLIGARARDSTHSNDAHPMNIVANSFCPPSRLISALHGHALVGRPRDGVFHHAALGPRCGRRILKRRPTSATSSWSAQKRETVETRPAATARLTTDGIRGH